MHIREREHVVRKIRRHITPFIFTMLRVIIVSIPFYVIAYFLSSQMSTSFTIYTYLLISVLVGFFAIYIAIMYFLDHLVITNQRLILVNWHSFWRKDEFETELKDIQDIRTREKGFLSKIRFLDYGIVEIETASSSTTIAFDKAPDPEEIRAYISTLMRHGKMGHDDTTGIS